MGVTMPVTGAEGGCSCGAVRYRLKAEPMFTHCCHCLDCQRQTGSAFALNALIEASAVEVLGRAPEPVPVPTDSGHRHDIYRCPECQVAVWSDFGGRRLMSFVRVSTLDDPHRVQPDVHIYTRSKVPWLTLPPDVPAFDAYYNTTEIWPEASLARREALRGR